MRLPYRFGKYTLTRRIAVGGTAEVYLATSGRGHSARTVAIKRLLPALRGASEMEAMLVDEARVLSHLSHPAIVRVHEHGLVEGTPFIAMEYVDGIDCARLLADSIRCKVPPPLPVVFYIVEQVLLALEFAHRSSDSRGRPQGIVHRDVSPQNILLGWDGGVKVTDFGIAKGTHRTHMTEIGQLKGKYAYMAPEQAMGMPVDSRADIFACGIVLWELVFARRLFEGESDIEVLEKVREARIGIEELRLHPPEIAGTLILALAPEPESRYPCASEMLCDVRGAARALGGMGTCYDLARYLGQSHGNDSAVGVAFVEHSPPAAWARTMPTAAVHLGRRSSLLRGAVRAAAIAASLAVVAAAPPSKGNTATSSASVVSAPQAAVPEMIQSASNPPPKRRAAIAIDSDPPRARGVLRLGDETLRIETPFALQEIDTGDGLNGRVEIGAAGFKDRAVEFKLGPSRPAFVEKIVLEPNVPAKLSVQARPWGVVDIEGLRSGGEAPVALGRVKPGSYAVRVTYPPTGQVASGRIRLREGESKSCLAKFGSRAEFSCR